jgi:hypothetical protein
MPRYEDVLGSGGIAPRIFNLGTRWRWVVSFTIRPPYRWYLLDRRLGGPQKKKAMTVRNTVQPKPDMACFYELHWEDSRVISELGGVRNNLQSQEVSDSVFNCSRLSPIFLLVLFLGFIGSKSGIRLIFDHIITRGKCKMRHMVMQEN